MKSPISDKINGGDIRIKKKKVGLIKTNLFNFKPI